jgi:hypothetical protein
MAYVVNFAETRNGVVTNFREFHHIDQARACMDDLFNGVANHENANEYQPTKFGKKDYFHFYVKHEDGFDEKRAYFITRLYKTKKYSVRTLVDQKERAIELGLPAEYCG